MLRKIKNKLKCLLMMRFFFSRIPLDYDASKNWGDKLTPYLITKLTGKKSYKPSCSLQSRFFVIGSILGRIQNNGLVWGAGFISQDAAPLNVPKKIYAVRGPLSRDIFLNHGIDCPPVYGDPAILLGTLLPMKRSKEFKYGIVPHYVDKNSLWVKDQANKFNKESLFIDIEDGIETFISQVCRCEYIISSSLHGLICADTYNIPSIRVVLSDLVIGGNFKFHDYRLGVGYKPHEVVDTRFLQVDLNDLIKFASLADVTCGKNNLLSVCPFKKIDYSPNHRIQKR